MRRLGRTLALAAAVLAGTVLWHGLAAAAGPERFDAGRAFEHLRQLVAIGPRPAGSVGAAETRRYILRQLSALAIEGTEQPFVADTPVGPTQMANVIGRIPGKSPRRLILAGHFDTKRFQDFRFVGANDGGSSTAMLLELARVLKGRANPLTIELLFFDGEEAVVEWTGSDHTYGSRHYVAAATRDGSLKSIAALVLFDMVGDRQLNIKREPSSTPWLTEAIWASARKQGQTAFVGEEYAVEDDHRPFLDAGVPAVNIIDLDYPAWHTADDTLDRISARSLQIVGDVFLDALPQIERRLTR